MKRYSTLLIIRELQIKILQDILPHACWNGYYQIKQEINAGMDAEKIEPLCTTAGNVNWFSPYRKQYKDSSKN